LSGSNYGTVPRNEISVSYPEIKQGTGSDRAQESSVPKDTYLYATQNRTFQALRDSAGSAHMADGSLSFMNNNNKVFQCSEAYWAVRP